MLRSSCSELKKPKFSSKLQVFSAVRYDACTNLKNFFWRRKAAPGKETAYKRTLCYVDTPPHLPPRPGQEENDSYAWISPAESPEKSDPFPEDGRFANANGKKEEFECSFVEVEGGSITDNFVHSGRARLSTASRGSLSQDRGSQREALGGSPLTDPISGDPTLAEEPGNAEDPAKWGAFLCGPDVVQNAANYQVFVAYYRRQFGSERRGGVVGKGPEEKTTTEDTLSRVFLAMRTLMRQPSVAENPVWIKGLLRDIAALDLKRDEAEGAGKRLIDAMRREYGFNKERPDWQKEARKNAEQRVKDIDFSNTKRY